MPGPPVETWQARGGRHVGVPLTDPTCVPGAVTGGVTRAAHGRNRHLSEQAWTCRWGRLRSRRGVSVAVSGPELPGVLGALAPLLNRYGYAAITAVIILE